MNVGFVDDKSYIIKKEKMNIIDNAGLIEPLHELRFKDVLYGEGFIVVPRFVFFPFSKWYKCTKTIQRKVVSYKSERRRALSMFKQRGPNTQSMIIAGT